MATFPNVTLIQNGQNVNQQNVNRYLNQIIERTNFLFEQLNGVQFSAGRIFLTGESVDDSVLDSHLVYFDDSANKWLRGLADFDVNSNSTEVLLRKTGFVQGIAKNITGSPGNRTADIFLYGLIDGIIPANLVEGGGSPSVGVNYFLSTSSQGSATDTKPEILEVFVGKFVSLTRFLFTPDISVNGAQHIHRSFTLDGSLFVDLGGGNFLYPAAEFPVFPPIQTGLTVLYVNGVFLFSGVHFTIDVNGLNYNHPLSTIAAPDPDPDLFYAVLFFVELPSSGQGVVTSINEGNDNVVITSCTSGDSANSGDLKIEVIPQLSLTENSSGSTVLKGIDVDSNGVIQVSRGEVVERIESGSGISVNRNQGSVTVSTVSDSGDGSRTIGDITLQNAKNNFVPGTPETFIELPQGIRASVTGRFSLDTSAVSAIQFILFYFGSISDGNQITLDINYKINKLGQSVLGGVQSRVVSLDISSVYTRNVLFEIAASELEPESSVSFTVSTSSSSLYTGDLNIIEIKRKFL